MFSFLFLLATSAAQAAASSPPLKVINYGNTSNGFNSPVRGWTSFGMQVHSATINPLFQFNQSNIIQQCDVLNTTLDGIYTYCNLDSGWMGKTDEFGRITYNESIFDIPKLATHLHSRGLLLGVYVVPGALRADADKTIQGTNTTIGEVCTGSEGLGRCVFHYDRPEVQQWHDSVVEQFALWEVDLIKLDYVTPGSPGTKAPLPANQSAAVVAYHQAIERSGRRMRLNISWKLNVSEEYFTIWNQNADSMRTDKDINAYGQPTFTDWAAIQRAVEDYREWSIAAVDIFDTVSVYPDWSTLYTGNNETLSGVTNEQRRTMMTHWIASGSNLILASDLTQLDDFGLSLLLNASALNIADFTAQYPMQPRNPGTGGQDPKQLQAWIAGPSKGGRQAVVVIANYGPDQGQGGYGGGVSGTQNVSVSWSDLGIDGCWHVSDVWAGESLGNQDAGVQVSLGEGESVLLNMTFVDTWRVLDL